MLGLMSRMQRPYAYTGASESETRRPQAPDQSTKKRHKGKKMPSGGSWADRWIGERTGERSELVVSSPADDPFVNMRVDIVGRIVRVHKEAQVSDDSDRRFVASPVLGSLIRVRLEAYPPPRQSALLHLSHAFDTATHEACRHRRTQRDCNGVVQRGFDRDLSKRDRGRDRCFFCACRASHHNARRSANEGEEGRSHNGVGFNGLAKSIPPACGNAIHIYTFDA